MNLVDLIIVALVAIGAFRGLRRGLVRSVLGLAGLVIGLVLASQLYRPLADYLELHYGTVSRMAAGITPHLPLASTVAATPAGESGALAGAIENLPLPELISRYLAAASEPAANLPGAATVGEALSHLLAGSIVGILCFVGIFIVTQVVTLLLASAISGLISITPLVVVDRLAGMALGAVYVAVILALVVGGLSLVSAMPGFAFVGPALEGSQVAPFLLRAFEFFMPRVPGWLSLG